MNRKNNQLTSSRKVGMRDINATLSAPISRIKTLRDDQGRNGFTLIELLVPSKGHPSVLMTGKNGLCCQVKPDLHDRKGFTLIELLVVVLIIGILAAVALPQYQKAVEKTRLTQAVTFISWVQKAIDIYVLENGMNGMTLDKLDIDVSAAYDKVCGAAGDYTCHIGCYDDEDGAECFVQIVANNKGKVDLMTGRTKTGNWGNTCSPANSEDKMAEFLCSSLRAQGWN